MLAALALAGSAEAVNPIPNAGFETSAGDPCDTPAQWSPLGGGAFGCPSPFGRDTSIHNTGSASARVIVDMPSGTSDTPDLSDCFPLSAGSYATSYAYDTDSAGVSATKFLVRHYSDPTGCKGLPGTQSLNVSTIQTGWHTVTGTLSFPIGTHFAQLQLGCTCVAGVINFDDVSLSALPTAVSVTAFGASRTAHGVVLRWHTASEAGTVGFNVYRQRAGGQRVRVNRILILARGSAGGAAYAVADLRAGSGAARYWLEAVDRSGAGTWRGPARVARR